MLTSGNPCPEPSNLSCQNLKPRSPRLPRHQVRWPATHCLGRALTLVALDRVVGALFGAFRRAKAGRVPRPGHGGGVSPEAVWVMMKNTPVLPAYISVLIGTKPQAHQPIRGSSFNIGRD